LSSRAERALVGLGSNLGERAAHLDAALAALADTGGVEVLAVSSYHETEPVGGPPGQGRYLNAVAEIETTLTPRQLLARLQEIERQRGRDRGREVRHGPRTLDLDLLTFGRRRFEDPDLIVPHPRMAERAFVQAPLAELAARPAPDGRPSR
jgi:2-amino-4-hydroxy-6-hydroxymethyldihydropteridine diphosphokinase